MWIQKAIVDIIPMEKNFSVLKGILGSIIHLAAMWVELEDSTLSKISQWENRHEMI